MTPEKIKALEAAAEATKGNRGPCHEGMAELYFRAGILPRLELPSQPLGWSRYQGVSLVEPWMDECPLFTSVIPPGKPQSLESIEPGDFVVFKNGHTTHHVAIMLEDGRYCHVFGEHGLRIAFMDDPHLRRLMRAWRPK